ncbi:hypothetical protein CONLIGDRAFT_587349 [Coniochaeta ligniaria NRRL 30616]|uniref:Zn(2)-C6 fungal-type domain-containing protein n=1 Tax=Coniochaeta ligniaria NRRL 30616 TaxID=1408157 RepID=A0A1J7I4P7_9PEZI|nr:hypothetical protein CONLIGDRAFT_587349 [Coniochaeta ligniaria NRRL 30616]
MPHGLRASHSKTRNGCSQCKKRRVRCNLQPPICANCERRKEACDYQLLGRVDPAFDEDGSPSLGSLNDEVSPTSTPDFRILDPLCTHAAVAERPEGTITTADLGLSLLSGIGPVRGHPFLEHLLSTEASYHEFLRHGLTSITALYTSSQQTAGYIPPCSDCLYVVAHEAQLMASRLFRDSVESITDHNWLAILAFGISVLIFHFDISQRAPATEFLETVFVLRSAAFLGTTLGPRLEGSRLHEVLQLLEKRAGEHDWDKAAEEAFHHLAATNTMWQDTSASYDVCQGAIAALQSWLRLVRCRPCTWLHFVWWPGAVSGEYLALLARQHPVALVIFVHWCAVMSRAPKRWFMDGWAKRTAEPALACLGPEWNDATAWARELLGKNPQEH